MVCDNIYDTCLRTLLTPVIMAYCTLCAAAQSDTIQSAIVEAALTTNASSGHFAPYYIGSLNHGKTTQKNGAFADVTLTKQISENYKTSYGYGAEILGGIASGNDYSRWCEAENIWEKEYRRPASFWLQQLYVEAKYRSLYIMAGLKEQGPNLLNAKLSSGDFVQSGNARPIPEIRLGFYDFVDVPLTEGWLQIQTQVSYGKMTDDRYISDRYNYYNYHIGSGAYYTYKYFYFRTDPDKRFHATFGMQSGGLFGGKCEYYDKGTLYKTNHYASDLQAFVSMLIPVLDSSEDFHLGSSLGSWDFYGQYRITDDCELAAYFQWPFEDGSGIARRNKIDGIWGLEYKGKAGSAITGVVVEYIDFRDQSGPIHFAPGDFNNPTIQPGTSGRDDYYNNGYYNSYANYGMSIGTPFLKSPLYNLDGYPAFACTRANGIHVGIEGNINQRLPYRALFGHQRGLGTYVFPYEKARTSTSAMIECIYQVASNLKLKAMVAFDKGQLRGDNFGALLTVSYTDLINIKH